MGSSNDAYKMNDNVRTKSLVRSKNESAMSPQSSRREKDEDLINPTAVGQEPTTYDNLTKRASDGSNDIVNKTELQHLDFEEDNLNGILLNGTKEADEMFLLRLRNRMQRAGIEVPSVEIRFEHLNIGTQVYAGSRWLPAIANFFANVAERFLSSLSIFRRRKEYVPILHDLSGIIKPGRMTLLLGPPSSGKTTLLLALAGQLNRDLKVSGRVSYNGHDMHEFAPQRSAAYISQIDLHLGEMTVRETLEFSSRCQGVGSLNEMLIELSAREKAANINPDADVDIFKKYWRILGRGVLAFNYLKTASAKSQESQVTDYVLKVLDLETCADTLVGDQMIRGISGGQRRRVTTGEMLVGPARVLLMDEISNGLDSSTTFQIINSLRQSIHILNGTAVVSLLQPEPETYDLFDDIILLCEGHIMYQGPRDCVLEFFECMGFKCPERKGIADFLQELTSRNDQRQYWVRQDEPYHFFTSKDFEEAFQSFHAGRKLITELESPFDKSKNHSTALIRQRYSVGMMDLFKACLSREYLLMKRNSMVYVFKLFQLTVVAFFVMTIFLHTKAHQDSILDGTVLVGALFFTVAMIMLNGLSEQSITVSRLPVFYKQRDLFFPSWAYALPGCILNVPIAFVEVSIWVFMSYYVIGYDSDVGRLFKQYLLLLILNQMASGLFRFIAAVSRDMIVASNFGSLVLVVLYSLGGFVLSREDAKKWWIWGYWASPLMYAQNGIVLNEFDGKSWSKVLPNATEPLGLVILRSQGLRSNSYWYWLCVGALFGFMVLFNVLYTLALSFLNPFTLPQVAKQVNTQGCEQLLTGENPVGAKHKKNGTLPFKQHFITFDEVRYSVDVSQGRSEILKGVSGAFRPGVLTALMGVSGAGKTTLMDILSGRKVGEFIEGDVRISTHTVRPDAFARMIGYCEQNDIHSPLMTVYESLAYSAWLRLAAEVDRQTRETFVEDIMKLVELTSLGQELVGSPGGFGLSTEQRKRLTIAVELVANPSIIFMDEPTSGLDSVAAAIIMRIIRNTADTGRTIVCTIHQPSTDIFESFDELLLLKHGGQEIYAGPLGHNSCHLVRYFEDIQGISSIKDGCNPATWMLEVTSPGQELSLGIDFAEIYRSSELYRRNEALIQELNAPPTGSKEVAFPTRYSQPFFCQFKACLWKQRRSYWRNTSYTGARLLFTAGLVLLFGSMSWNLGSKMETRHGIFNALGSIYAAVLFLGIQNASTVQPVVAIERSVFYRERAAGLYSATAYALAQTVVEIPYTLVQTLVYGVIVYAMIGFEWTAAKILWFLFFVLFTFLYFTYFGMMTAAMTPNTSLAAMFAAFFYALWNLFCGFLVPRPRIPVWWRWCYWTCPMAWTFYGLVISQFGDNKAVLDDGATVEEFLRDYFGFEQDFLAVVAGGVVGFTVFFALLFAISIQWFNFHRR